MTLAEAKALAATEHDAESLKELRERAGLTADALSKMLGISRNHVYMTEKGRRQASRAHWLACIAAVLLLK